MLYGHLDAIFLHIYAKIKPSAISTLHYCLCVPETNMPTELGIYAIFTQYMMGNMADVYAYMCQI